MRVKNCTESDKFHLFSEIIDYTDFSFSDQLVLPSLILIFTSFVPVTVAYYDWKYKYLSKETHYVSAITPELHCLVSSHIRRKNWIFNLILINLTSLSCLEYTNKSCCCCSKPQFALLVASLTENTGFSGKCSIMKPKPEFVHGSP